MVNKTKHSLKSVLGWFLPIRREEFAVCFLFLAVYLIHGLWLASSFTIIYDERIPWDAYYSFDNRSIVQTGGGAERHPFSAMLFHSLRDTALFLSGGSYGAGFRSFWAVVGALLCSLSLVQIWRYFRQVQHLPVLLSAVLIVFTGFTSTFMLMSFTPETYSWSMYLLLVYLNYGTTQIIKHKKIGWLPQTLAAVGIGGLTITNLSKVFGLLLFQKDYFGSVKKFFKNLFPSVVALGIFILLFILRFSGNLSMIIGKTGEQYEKFSNPKKYSILEMTFNWFFGANIIFPDFVTREYHNTKGFYYKAMFPDMLNVPQIIFVASLLFLVMLSLWQNRKNALAGILAFWLLTDVMIHVVLKFGLHVSFVYGAHFIYTLPLLLGWLWVQNKKRKTARMTIMVIAGILTVFLVSNNVLQMGAFHHLLELYYR